MKLGLLLVSVSLLLLGGFFYLRMNAEQARAVEFPAASQAASAPIASDQLSSDPSAPESRVPGDPNKVVTGSDTDGNAASEMHPELNLFPVARRSAEDRSTVAELNRADEAEFFNQKYTGRTAKDRLLALDRLRSFVIGHEAATEEKDRLFSEDQIQAMRLEIDWIKSHPGS